MTWLEGVGTIVGLIASAFGVYVSLKLKPLEDGLRSAKEEAKMAVDDAEQAINTVRADLERRVDGLHADVKTERAAFELRLADIEKTYISRAELTTMIKDLGNSFERGVLRLEQKLDHLTERIGRVEAQP